MSHRRHLQIAKRRHERHVARRARAQHLIARQRMSATSRLVLSPLKATIMAALGLSQLTGCQVSEPLSADSAGDSAGDAGEPAGDPAGEPAGVLMAGEPAGLMAGIMAGEPAGLMAGIMAGEPAGLMAGLMAGEPAGIMAGEPAGVMAGEPAGVMAGELAGDTPPDPFCAQGETLLNDNGEPNGYTRCEGGAVIKTGPANCFKRDAYFECTRDDDCAAGEQCVCGSLGLSFNAPDFAACAPANCETSDECDVGGCGVSLFEDGCNFELSLACHTESDACRGPEACMDTSGLGCYASPDGWMCSEFQCAVGRPLLDQGACRVAPLESGEGWVEETLSLSPLSEGESRVWSQVCDTWSEVAQLEHSSVASFARFTLDLMALGAPADLLLATQEAAADEVRHAQRALEIASALRGEKLSFGALSVEGLSVGSRRAVVLDRLIREACFGETLGVAEVSLSMSLCDDPTIHAHLAEVLEDETRHAGLAWRSLQWLIESAPEAERAQLIDQARETFAELTQALMSEAREVSEPSISETEKRGLNRLGVLTQAQTTRAHHTAYREVIAPSLIGLGLLSAA